MLEKTLQVGSGNEQIKYLAQAHRPNELYGVYPLKNYIQFTAVSIPQNEIREWKIENDLEPITLWIFEANVAVNKTIRWVIKDDLDSIIFDVTLTAAQFTQLGNSLYWHFPEATVLKAGYEAYLACNFQVDGISVNCLNCHVERSIEGRFVNSI